MNIGRCSGILLHLTSLPGEFGIGDLGPESRNFVDFLFESGQKLWCVLPLGPTGEENSPYQSRSAFAGNPLLLSPRLLVQEGYLSSKDLKPMPPFPTSHIAFRTVRRYKEALFQNAFRNFSETKQSRAFERKHAYWLDSYALFMALHEANGGIPWTDFAPDRKPSPQRVRYHKFLQYEFFRQWQALREYCSTRGIAIMGDMPFYLEHNSADVWSNPSLFDLRKDGTPRTVGGVPPDYFSADGQLWGTPTYRWNRMQKDHYKWWTRRLKAALDMVDLLRLDHFRGFEAFWSVSANQSTARKGRWVQGPGLHFFKAVRKQLGPLQIVAENLGTITPGVEELRQRCGFPGMAVLQFGFDEEGTHRPPHYVPHQVCFTGTHDNDTTVGWWRQLQHAAQNRGRKADRDTVQRVKSYLQLDCQPIHWAFIQAIQSSIANIAIVPMQDVLGFDSSARMNMPGRAKGNWRWRLEPHHLSATLRQRLRQLTTVTGRFPTST